MPQIGLGIIHENPGDETSKMLIRMDIVENLSGYTMVFSDEENYETDIDTLMKGLREIKADMRRLKSGLVVVKGGLPDGLRKPQGRKLGGPRSAG